MSKELIFKTLFGKFQAVYSPDGLQSLSLLGKRSKTMPTAEDDLDADGRLIADALEAYARGDKQAFEGVKLDLTERSAFEQEVLQALREVPWGSAVSYKELAESIGRPGAARAVGTVMAKNPVILINPCHRVVHSDGTVSGYSAEGGVDTKIKFLEHEGLEVKRGRVKLGKRETTRKEEANEAEGGFRSGFVAIVGRPNSGKSTLLNRLLGQPIAGVSAKPQTTRKRQLGILTTDEAQIIFLDTPGFHDPVDKLSEFINAEASYALADADLVVFLADSSSLPEHADQQLLKLLQKRPAEELMIAMTKIDLMEAASLKTNQDRYSALLPGAQVLQISAKTGAGLEAFLAAIAAKLPFGPKYYPEDQITEDFERDIAAEMIRASAMERFSDEIPYSLAVQVVEYKERETGDLFVHAILYVEREAQKGIVIGKKGQAIKELGIAARTAIEAMADKKVYLSLEVKTQKDWKNDPRFLKEMGLAKPKG